MIKSIQQFEESGIKKLEKIIESFMKNPKDMASFVHARFRAKGVHLMLKTAVSGFEEREGCILTHVDGGEPLCSEMAILAIGVSPDSSLAREAGLALGARGAGRFGTGRDRRHPGG